MDEKKYSQLYQALLQEVLQFHSGNQRRIRKGMLSLLLVPLAFLVLLFLSDGSRVIFLLLWIVSMFGIAAYLIAVEYIDYEMQSKVKKITQKEVELDRLTALPTAMPQLLPRLRGEAPDADAPASSEACDGPENAPLQPVSAKTAEPCDNDDNALFARLFDERAWDQYYGAQKAGQSAAYEAEAAAPATESAVLVEETVAPAKKATAEPAPAEPAAPNAPDLSRTLAGIQTDVQQLARGLEQLSCELGRISRYMEDQENRTREAGK